MIDYSLAMTQLFNFKQKVDYKTEILAGLTVAMTMIPESLSFAILAKLPPLVGLYAAFIAGLVTSVFGGRPGMISGGAGATVIVLIALMKSHGIEYVFAAVALGGIVQICIGLFKLGKFIRLVPQPVMYGFVNGLAVVIFMSQLEQFKIVVNGQTTWLQGSQLYIMLALVALTIGIVLLFSKITKAVPASLVAIIVVFAIVLIFNIDTKTVQDIASVKGGFPPFHIPNIPLSFETIKIILVTSDKNFTIEAPKYECNVYYLVKPITEDRFQKAIQKANSVSSSATRIVNNRRYCKRILH